MEKTEDAQWCIYSIDYWNYSISLGEEALKKIKSWENVTATIYHDSYLFRGKEDIRERMRRELVLWLLSDQEYSEKNRDVIMRSMDEESKKVIVDISKNLVDNLLQSEGNESWYCYNTRWNKISFYTKGSPDSEKLEERIELLKKLYKKE